MKTKFIYTIVLTWVITIFLGGCIEEFGETGEPFNRTEQVVGTWTVTKVVQRDLLTENPLFETYDITSLFDFAQYSVTLNADGTFSVANTGNAPDFVLTSGTWVLDDPDRPATILLTGQDSTSVLNFRSLNTLTESNELETNFIRKVQIPDTTAIGYTIVPAISYEYTLSKSN